MLSKQNLQSMDKISPQTLFYQLSNFTFFRFYVYVCFTCMYVYICMCVLAVCMYAYHFHVSCPWRPEEGTRFYSIGLENGCKSPCGCLELNPEPLEEQPVLSTAQSALQLHNVTLKGQ